MLSTKDSPAIPRVMLGNTRVTGKEQYYTPADLADRFDEAVLAVLAVFAAFVAGAFVGGLFVLAHGCSRHGHTTGCRAPG